MGRCKRLFEGKGVGCFTVSTQVVKALLCLLYAGVLTGGDPPKRQVRALEALKPLTALLHYRTMPT